MQDKTNLQDKTDTKKKAIIDEILAWKKKAESIVIKHMPKFDMGIAEASIKREAEIWQDIKKVLIKNKLNPSVSIKLCSENQASKDPLHPDMTCSGVEVNIIYKVFPVDKEGNFGQMDEETMKKLGEIGAKVKKLQDELEA